jgi:hypothetical protein
MKLEKKFYLGARHIADAVASGNPDAKVTVSTKTRYPQRESPYEIVSISNYLQTLDEAVAEAQKKCAETDLPQIVVQIVKVIKPIPKPVSTEDVE